MKRARKKDAKETRAVAVWREKNMDGLWEAFLELLKCQSDEKNCFVRDESGAVNAMQNCGVLPALPPMHDFANQQGELNIMNSGGENGVVNVAIESVDRCNSEMQQGSMQTTQQLQSKRPRKRPASEHEVTENDLHSTIDNSQVVQQHMNESQEFQIEPAFFYRQRTDDPTEPTKKQAKKTHSIPSFLELCCLVPTEEKAVEYLSSYSIFTLPKDTICTHCGYKGFRRKQKNNPKSLKCNRCSKGRSITRGTFFEHSKASLRTILYLAAHWLNETPRADTITQLKCSSATITEFHRNFRNVIKQSLDDNLRLAALTADKKAIVIPKGARRRELEEHCCVAFWKDVNREHLWESFLSALRICYPIDTVEGHSVEGDRVWVDGEKGAACCKYHLKKHQLRS